METKTVKEKLNKRPLRDSFFLQLLNYRQTSRILNTKDKVAFEAERKAIKWEKIKCRVSSSILNKGGDALKFYFYARSLDKTGCGIVSIGRKDIQLYAEELGYSLRTAYAHAEKFRKLYCHKEYRKSDKFVCSYKGMATVAYSLGLDSLGAIAEVQSEDLHKDNPALSIILTAIQGQRQSQYLVAVEELEKKGGLEKARGKKRTKETKLAKVDNPETIFSIWYEGLTKKTTQAKVKVLNNDFGVSTLETGDGRDRSRSLDYLISLDSIYYLKSDSRLIYGISQEAVGDRLGGLSQPSVSTKLSHSRYIRIHQYVRVSRAEYDAVFLAKDEDRLKYTKRWDSDLGQMFYFRQYTDLYLPTFILLGCTHLRRKLRVKLNKANPNITGIRKHLVRKVLDHQNAQEFVAF